MGECSRKGELRCGAVQRAVGKGAAWEKGNAATCCDWVMDFSPGSPFPSPSRQKLVTGVQVTGSGLCLRPAGALSALFLLLVPAAARWSLWTTTLSSEQEGSPGSHLTKT